MLCLSSVREPVTTAVYWLWLRVRNSPHPRVASSIVWVSFASDESASVYLFDVCLVRAEGAAHIVTTFDPHIVGLLARSVRII